MTPAEVEQCMQKLMKLFPAMAEVAQGGDDELSLWRSDFARLDDPALVMSCIEDAKRNTRYQRVSFPEIFGRIKAAKAASQPQDQKKETPLADSFRRDLRLGDHVRDAEVFIRHYHAIYFRAQALGRADVEQVGIAQQQLCAGSLNSLGMDAETAKQFAALVIEDGPVYDAGLDELLSVRLASPTAA